MNPSVQMKPMQQEPMCTQMLHLLATLPIHEIATHKA